MRLPSRVAAVAGAVVLMAGGATLATAPTAAAVPTPSNCQYRWYTPHNAKTTAGVNLRTGPSTGYTSLGTLAKGTGFTHYCIAYPNGTNWRGARSLRAPTGARAAGSPTPT
ncbi:SH3 domain-containing protein [Streptomyces viridosporus]|uniref:hypothetical protein n=1 Tax=Streptomyces viridosporus TaxID=67581 RepID=UPI0036F76C77